VLPVSMFAASSAGAARRSVVLKANGQVLLGGAPYTVAMAPDYYFRTKVSVNDGKPSLEEIGCSAFNEVGTIGSNSVTNTWSLSATSWEELCGGEKGSFLRHDLIEDHLSFSGPHTARNEATIEVEREEREVNAEREAQELRGEEVHLREPLECTYVSRSSKGGIPTNGQPLVVTIRGKMNLLPSQVSHPGHKGCGLTGKWEGTFTFTSGGYPIVAALE
jgi:hypothetical protein